MALGIWAKIIIVQLSRAPVTHQKQVLPVLFAQLTSRLDILCEPSLKDVSIVLAFVYDPSYFSFG